MDLTKVRRDDWILAGVALVLAIDLLFFPWFDISVGPFSASTTATGAPDGLFGVLALLCTLALIADLAVERLSPQTRLPALGGSRASTRFALAVAIAVLLAVKFILNIHFDLFSWGFYLAVLLTAALVFLSLQARRGEAFAMPSRLQGMGGQHRASAPDSAPPAAGPPPASGGPLISDPKPPPEGPAAT
ncbi:MAG: hypothetical protein QOG59_3112 [Solirubrobacteraceae bacterium]|nr:hypothetical protein [Solirubrobacteraceae bacterium]